MGFLQKIARSKGPQVSNNPDVFRIDSSPVKGAGMACFATRALSRSDIVLTVQDPVASVVMKKFRKEVCAWCYAFAANSSHKIKVSLPTGRGVAWFCQLECRDYWKENVGEAGWEAMCAFEDGLGRTKLPSLERPDSPGSLEQIESLWERALYDGERIIEKRLAKPWVIPKTATLPAEVDINVARFILSSFISFSKSKELIAVVNSLIPSLIPYTTSRNTLEAHIKIYHYILSVIPVSSQILEFVSPVNVVALITRDATNSWGVWDESLVGDELLAYCLFPAASLFNHSCAPNMELQRNGRAYTFHAKEDVALGAELNVTYLGQNVSQLGFRERQDRLLSGWGFTCLCSRCTREGAEVLLEL